MDLMELFGLLLIAYPETTARQALEQLHTALDTGAAANVACKWLVGQGVDTNLAKLLCSKPSFSANNRGLEPVADFAQRIKYFTDLMGNTAAYTTEIRSDETGRLTSNSKKFCCFIKT
ncbi:unnamed protein product [Protopolystoma xenopodis]|uniref:Uncharacterized protein n=1 Tax=Protopolystoma xenopodis TaxID=117903 RepID=A0A448WBD5_9PLAT|nr:unnamed protein product [Protopolystoma xenopodis]